jgi:alpha-tubulin suppressor-like RCC1 family protein
MHSKQWVTLAALAGAALIAMPAAAGREDFKSDYFPLDKNLAVQIAAPGAVGAQIGVSIPGLREDLKYELGLDEHGLITGGIYIPPAESARVEVVAFNADGKAIYRGATEAFVDRELTPEFQVPLEGRDLKEPLNARFGSNLLTAGIVGEVDDHLRVQLTLVDGYGSLLPFSPDDFEWRLPEGFPEIKYSCFNGALCILEWKPTKEQEIIYLCLKLEPYPCITRKPDDFRGPYKYVATGRNHTCAITRDDDIRCWGDNSVGQLGTPTTATCFTVACSKDPMPVVCPAGAVCKFKSVAAGGDHTCAVDTQGKAWCWGQDGSEAVGEPWFGSQPNHTHRNVPANMPLGGSANFAAIDTGPAHTCALTATQDIFCWGANASGELGWPTSIITNTFKATMIANGNKYRSITTGAMHSCAIQTNGLLDCWGDNTNFQLTGNTNSSTFITVNPKIPLLTGRTVKRVGAGTSGTCAESSDDNVICWGKPAISASASTRSPGYVALFASSSTSLATDAEDCAGGSANCSQHCVTDGAGELQCGWWVTAGTPQLSKVKKPWTDYGVDWTQTDVGPNHVCAVTSEFDIWCFGKNDHGQFGNGTVANSVIDTTKPQARTNR